MKTFVNYVRFREALVADDRDKPNVDDQEVFELLANIMKDAWLEDPELAMKALHVLEQERPTKFRSRIEQIKDRKKGPYGRGLDKPDNQDAPEVMRPISDRGGNPMEGE